MSAELSVSITCKYRKNSNTNADNHLIRQNSAWNTQHDYTKLNCKQGPWLSFFFFPLMFFSFKSQDTLFSLCLSFISFFFLNKILYNVQQQSSNKRDWMAKCFVFENSDVLEKAWAKLLKPWFLKFWILLLAY